MCASFSHEDVEVIEVFRQIHICAYFIEPNRTMQAHFRHWGA